MSILTGVLLKVVNSEFPVLITTYMCACVAENQRIELRDQIDLSQKEVEIDCDRVY